MNFKSKTKKKVSNSVRHNPSCSTFIDQPLNIEKKLSSSNDDESTPSGDVWGFLPSETVEPTVVEEKTFDNRIGSPAKMDEINVEPVQIFTEPKIVIRKIRFDDPSHYPVGVPYVMIKELIQEFHPSLRYKMMRKRRRRVSSHEEYQQDNEIDGDDDDEDEDVQTRRKRIHRHNANHPDPIGALAKKSRDRFAKKTLEIEENPEENSSFQRFQHLLDTFDDDFHRYRDELDETHLDLLLPNGILEEMSELSEKLKLSTYFTSIDRAKLRRLIEILSLRIQQGIEINPLLDDDQTWRSLIFERLTNCCNACEIALNIMTTSNMGKEMLMENAIEQSMLFIKSQLVRTIYPEFDPLYRTENQSKDSHLIKQKRSKIGPTQCKQMQFFYNKIVSLFQGVSDLIPLSKFTDTIILSISSFTVSCIFVENIFDLQAHSLNILSEIFTRYVDHRDSILDDLLLSFVRLPTSKKSLRCYRLPSGDFIQMFSALIMQLIHSVVSTTTTTSEFEFLTNYSTAQNVAFKFLTLFFRSCGMKNGEDDHRRIFENFLDDLLITANRPEWPSSEILLTLLSRILMTNFSNANLPLPIRLQSLEYLGSVAAQLRRDSIDVHVLNLRENQLRLERIVEKILNNFDFDVETMKIYRNDSLKFHRCLILHLNELNHYDPSISFAKMFHLSQWIRDVCWSIERLTRTLTRAEKPMKIDLIDDEIDETTTKTKISVNDQIEMKKKEKNELLKFLRLPTNFRAQFRQTFDDDEELCLLMRFLSSHRPFLKTFDVYLKQLAAIFQSESGSHLRSKAMKCLCTVVEADPTVLGRNDIKSCVHVGLTDKSISVREAAIDLIGRYIVNNQQLILQYYDVLCERSIDTGVSVRKRVVKIFRDICLSQPNFVRLPDICSRLLRRINDEETIKKFVFETFQQLWFVPTKDSIEIRHRVQTLIDILIDGQKQNHVWLENLIKKIGQTNDDDVQQAIRDLIVELVESILKIETLNDQISSNKMVATFIAIYALGKAAPSNILPHFSTIVEYLNIKCTSPNDNIIVQYVAKILEVTVPLMRSAASSVVYSLEGSLTKLLLVSGQLVIHSSIACLAAVIRLSKNFPLVKEVFQRYHSYVVQCREKLKKKMIDATKNNGQLARSIYIVGVLCKYFDFEKLQFSELEFSSDDLFQLFLYFIHRSDSLVKLKSLVALGFFLQRYGHFLVDEPIRDLYHAYLLDRRSSAVQLRCQVLINLEEYFRDCIRRMAEYDVDYLQTTNVEISTGENLKETSDVHSEMASSIAQCYLRIVLETYLTDDETIRQCVRKVVTCILEQGLVHPVQFIPYLIAMTTDHDINIQQTAEQNLQDLDKTHPGIIQTKVLQGLKMSFHLQKILFSSKFSSRTDLIRGMTKLLVTSYSHQQLPFCSVNHFLYSLIRSSRVYRRALINHLIKMFDNENSPLTLEEQLFIADNLAYFPYQVQDEPLFLVEQIDLTVSVSGSTQLHQLREILKEKFSFSDDDETNDPLKFEESFSRVSNDVLDDFYDALRQTKATLLLLLLKSFLKEVYFLDETKIIEYDHSESSKILDRPILTRQINIKFEPRIILETIRGLPKFYDRNEKNQRFIYEFLEFKRHLLAFDNVDEENLHSITELLPSSAIKTKKSGRTSSKRRKVMVDSDDDEPIAVNQ